MRIAEREEQIWRIKAASFQSEVNEELQQHLRSQVVTTVQATLEAALVEEVKVHLKTVTGEKPRRCGYFGRVLDTQYGRIQQLHVPKLRFGNKERSWQILERYQRSMNGLLDMAGYLYMLGLSLRDLQEAFYFLLGSVLSRTAVNRVTLRVQERMQKQRQAALVDTPPILIVDGVWVSIQYTLASFKLDRAGHQRQCRQAQERVILVVMAVWPDGSYHILDFAIATAEDQQAWRGVFEQLIARGLDPQQVQLVVSDGAKGVLEAMAGCLPQAKQQRCITHKVRGMERYLTYHHLPTQDEQGSPLTEAQAKQQRWATLKQEAYAIYDLPSLAEAQAQLQAFQQKWQPLEPKAVHAFLWGIKRTFTFYEFGKELFVHIRTTNHVERFFREFRAKADEVGAFPNEASCLTLFFLVMLRDHAKHNRLSMAKTL